MSQQIDIDIDKFINGLKKQIGPALQIFKNMGFFILLLILFALVKGSVFTIEPEEVGVITRFGKFNRTVDPGLNFKLPLGLEDVKKVPIQRQLKEEFGFRTSRADVRTNYRKGSFKNESLMLTGDLNAAEVMWIVQYRIQDAYKFLFKVRNVQKTFRDITEAVMRGVVGDRTVNEVLTVGRAEIETKVKIKIQELCDQYDSGIKVDQVVLQDVNPPDEVKQAFNEVNEAQQEREKLINEAKAEYNRTIPKAKGEAERTIETAKGYALERVNQAKGKVAAFNYTFAEYSKAKSVTRTRLHLEAMQDILSKVDKKMITESKLNTLFPLLQNSVKGQ